MDRTRIYLFLLTPVLFFLSFPPFPAGYLAFMTLTPFFALLERDGYRSGFRTGYITGLLTVGLFLYWINWNSGATAVQASGMYVSMALYLALWWGLFAVLQNFICRRFGRNGLLAGPFIWTSLEYLQSFGSLGFPWHSLATTQTPYPYFIQFIQYTGMYGITFWATAMNVLFYLAVKSHADRREKISPDRLPVYAVSLTIIFLLPVIHGLIVYSDAEERNGRAAQLAVVQPNIEPNRKWLERDFAFNRLMEMTQSLRDSAKDMIIWPETAFPSRLRMDPYKKKTLVDEIRLQNTTLLTGIPDKKIAENDQGEFFYRHFNSVFFIRPDSSFGVYDKIHLVPLGEYVPDFLFLIKDFAMDVGASNYSPGDSVVVFTLPLSGGDSLRFSSVICYESVFSQLVRSFVLAGAEMIVIVTNDAWYDATIAPEQHAYIAVLRAIEHRVPVIRCANSGVSCLILPSGKMTETAPNPTQAVLRMTARAGTTGTFFTRYGEWFPASAVILSCILLIGLSGLRIFQKPRQ